MIKLLCCFEIFRNITKDKNYTIVRIIQKNQNMNRSRKFILLSTIHILMDVRRQHVASNKELWHQNQNN